MTGGTIETGGDLGAASPTNEVSRSALQTIFRHFPGVTAVLDGKGRILAATASASELFRGDAAGAEGKMAVTFLHPDDQEPARALLAEVAAAPRCSRSGDIRLRHPDGTWHWFEAHATNLTDNPAFGGILVRLRDVTERRRQEERLRDLFERAPVAYSIIDLEGRQVAGNQRYADLFGYTVEELDGLDVVSITHPDDRDRTAGYLTELATGRSERHETEKRYIRKDGSVFWGRLTITALHDLDGRPELLLGAIEDVTERRAATEALARARDQALSASEAKSEFVAHVAHDLRTPLHAVRGLAELLATGDEAAPADLAAVILRTSDSMLQMLDDLLDLAKMEAGRLELAPAPFSPRRLLADVGDLLAAQATAKGLDLVVDPDPSLPEALSGDAGRLRQVLVNLAGNAVKFTDRGRVTLHASARPGDGDWILGLRVSDTGVGIPAEARARIFDPFVQAHRERPGGTGLGLAICRQLVELMEGTITMDSEEGRGSTFGVEVPMSGVEPAGAEPAPEAPAPAVRDVLVVEDTPVNQVLVSRQLERLGHRPVIAATGEEALDLFGELRPAVVLMDWRLPGIDGLETTRRLRRLEQEQGRDPVPVIAMTASALAKDKDRCLEAGMDDFLPKPVSLAALDAMLRQWMPGPGDSGPPAGEPEPARAAPPDDPGPGPEAAAGATAGGGHSGEAGADPPAELARLYEEVGNAALVETVIAAFAAALPERRARIAEAGVAGDRDTLADVAHTLRSTSAQLGATEVAARSTTLEELARSGGDGLDRAVEDLLHHIDLLEATLTRWRNRTAAGG